MHTVSLTIQNSRQYTVYIVKQGYPTCLAPTCLNTPVWKFLVCLVRAWLAGLVCLIGVGAKLCRTPALQDCYRSLSTKTARHKNSCTSVLEAPNTKTNSLCVQTHLAIKLFWFWSCSSIVIPLQPNNYFAYNLHKNACSTNSVLPNIVLISLVVIWELSARSEHTKQSLVC